MGPDYDQICWPAPGFHYDYISDALATCREQFYFRWVKKGKQSHFGYRSYVSVDSGDGYIRGVHTAPANENETPHLQNALAVCGFKPARAYAGKGYASAGNRAALAARQIKSAIMHRAYWNKPLTAHQIKANKLIGKRRYIVEQSFGTVKLLFAMALPADPRSECAIHAQGNVHEFAQSSQQDHIKC